MSTEVLEQTDRLVLKRNYKSTLDAMWAAWTEKEKIEQWMGCAQTKSVNATVDLRVGGTLRLEMGHEDGDCFSAVCVFTEITPKTRLAYTWNWEGDPEMAFGETQVELEFRQVGDEVELTLRHSGFPNAELVGMHQGGWQGSLDKLETALAG